MARDGEGRILRRAGSLREGEPVQVILARGTVDARVERTRADGTEELLS